MIPANYSLHGGAHALLEVNGTKVHISIVSRDGNAEHINFVADKSPQVGARNTASRFRAAAMSLKILGAEEKNALMGRVMRNLRFSGVNGT